MTESRLGKVKRGRIATGRRFTFYGPEAVGKTSLAADTKMPIFFDLEDGSTHLDVPRYPFKDGPMGHVPETYEDVMVAIADLIHNDHPYGTLVIDTIDRLEPMIWDYCCKRDSGKVSNLNKNGKKLISIESYGYGRGYVVALEQWRLFASRLDRLRTEKQVEIILLSHSQVRTFKNPEGEDYDRYQIRLKDNAASFIKEWSDVLGFCTFEETVAKLNEDDLKAKGYSTGRRLIMTERTSSYDAKSRIPLPTEIELSELHPWQPLQYALNAGSSLTPTELRSRIEGELNRIRDEEISDKVNKAVNGAGDDVAVLSRYLNKLRRMEPKEGQAA